MLHWHRRCCCCCCCRCCCRDERDGAAHRAAARACAAVGGRTAPATRRAAWMRPGGGSGRRRRRREEPARSERRTVASARGGRRCMNVWYMWYRTCGIESTTADRSRRRESRARGRRGNGLSLARDVYPRRLRRPPVYRLSTRSSRAPLLRTLVSDGWANPLCGPYRVCVSSQLQRISASEPV